MPGHAAVNERLVRDHRDPHLTKTATGYEETDISKCLSRTADAFFGEPYLPKSKSGMLASSSVDSGNDPVNAYYAP